MMRARLACLAPLVTLAAVALAVTLASPAASVGASSAAARAADLPSVWQRLALSVSPAPADLTLLAIGLRRGAPESISKRSFSVSVQGLFGDDYLAAAVARHGTRGGPRVLVLIVNRPSPLLDPAHVRLRIAARRALGALSVRRLSDPLTHPLSGVKPALCAVPLRGPSLGASDLRSLGSRGAPLAALGAAAAVAQAYDLACGLPHAASFAQALRSATPAPTPGPPVPEAPGCTPCVPPPGSACPLAGKAHICAAPASSGARRAGVGAH